MDFEIAEFFFSLKGSFIYSVFQIITGKIYIFFTGLAFVIFAVSKLRSKVFVFILAVFVAVALSDLICYRVLKPLIGRSRPSIVLDKDCKHKSGQANKADITGGLGEMDYSMPSNHASNIFAFFTVYFMYIRKFRGLLFINSLLIAVSRIVVVKHYVSDVFAGIVIGIVIGLAVVYIFSLFGYKPAGFKRGIEPISGL